VQRAVLHEYLEDLAGLASKRQLSGSTIAARPPGRSVVRSMQTADNHAAQIYSATQTAVRAVVAGVTMEALLTQRVAIGA
jgi:hypothetical protein